MSEPTVVWSIEVLEQCAKIQNHLVWEALEFWNSASLSILAQNIDFHHLKKKKGFSFLTHCNSVREIQHSKNTSECLTVKTPSLLQLCFKIVSIFFFSIKLSSWSERRHRLHSSFAFAVDVFPRRHVCAAHLMHNLIFAAACSFLTMCQNKYAHCHRVWWGKKDSEISPSGSSF